MQAVNKKLVSFNYKRKSGVSGLCPSAAEVLRKPVEWTEQILIPTPLVYIFVHP